MSKSNYTFAGFMAVAEESTLKTELRLTIISSRRPNVYARSMERGPDVS